MSLTPKDQDDILKGWLQVSHFGVSEVSPEELKSIPRDSIVLFSQVPVGEYCGITAELTYSKGRIPILKVLKIAPKDQDIKNFLRLYERGFSSLVALPNAEINVGSQIFQVFVQPLSMVWRIPKK